MQEVISDIMNFLTDDQRLFVILMILRKNYDKVILLTKITRHNTTNSNKIGLISFYTIWQKNFFSCGSRFFWRSALYMLKTVLKKRIK
jgi:hypothetical protein